MGNPSDFYKNVIEIKSGALLDRNVFLRHLVSSLYVRNDLELGRGNFRVKGDTVDVSLAYSDHVLRVTFWDDEIESIEEIDPDTGARIAQFEEYKIYPANLFMTTKESTMRAIVEIEKDLAERVDYFKEIGKPFEAKRLHERVTYDTEMLPLLSFAISLTKPFLSTLTLYPFNKTFSIIAVYNLLPNVSRNIKKRTDKGALFCRIMFRRYLYFSIVEVDVYMWYPTAISKFDTSPLGH